MTHILHSSVIKTNKANKGLDDYCVWIFSEEYNFF